MALQEGSSRGDLFRPIRGWGDGTRTREPRGTAADDTVCVCVPVELRVPSTSGGLSKGVFDNADRGTVVRRTHAGCEREGQPSDLSKSAHCEFFTAHRNRSAMSLSALYITSGHSALVKETRRRRRCV
jgi:hypothetical protein